MNERPAKTFERKTFTVSRLAEFVSESELVKQIGHPVADWPLVIVEGACRQCARRGRRGWRPACHRDFRR